MGINNSTIAAGATLSATGGTSYSLTMDGLEIKNGVHVVDASNADIRTRKNAAFKSIPATIKSGNWTNDKREVSLTHPKILANGEQKFPVGRISISTHPENTQAELDALRYELAQILFDPDYAAFWRAGSLA